MADDLQEMLDQEAERARDEMPRARDQVELTNRVFTLLGVQFTEWKTSKFGPGSGYIGTLILDGSEEEEQFWLGGIIVKAQIAAMVRDSRFPAILTQVQDGKAYRLAVPSVEVKPARRRPRAKTPPQTAPVNTIASEIEREPDWERAFIDYVRENNLDQDKGVGVLTALGIDPGVDPVATWRAYYNSNVQAAGGGREGKQIVSRAILEQLQGVQQSEGASGIFQG